MSVSTQQVLEIRKLDTEKWLKFFTNLWYVFPLGNLISGESHANENVTVLDEPEGIFTEAAMAAPMVDPCSEVVWLSSYLWGLKDPCYKRG